MTDLNPESGYDDFELDDELADLDPAEISLEDEAWDADPVDIIDQHTPAPLPEEDEPS